MVLEWIKENRMKVASSCGVLGDFLLGLAGGINIFNYHIATTAQDFMLVAASAMFLTAHGLIFLWGKGGRMRKLDPRMSAKEIPVVLRPLFPWHYPFDSGCILWATGGVLVLLVGITMPSMNFLLTGICLVSASLINWLWPQERPIFGLRLMQFTAIIYATSSLNLIAAALTMGNDVLLAAGCSWLICNVIYGTVRKVNQSVFTQATDSHSPS